jgi:signal transduction histidine kinase
MLWNSRLLAEKLKEADRLQREFIHVAAHELRTPIQPILGMAELIESTLQKKKDASIKPEEIEMIARNARRLQKLSEEILEIARIESNSLTLHKSLFNLKDVLILLIEDCKKQIQMDGREVKVISQQLSDYDDIKVYADKERTMQVLGNLLSNTLKFTRQGTITVSAERSNDKGQVTVKVTDTGLGIDPALLSRLFTKFATKSDKGTGLGLYISKSIVEAHGGKIWAENNNDGRGATFTFTLPIQKPHQEQLSSL